MKSDVVRSSRPFSKDGRVHGRSVALRIYETQFEFELKVLIPDTDEAEEFLRGLEWIVARKPGSGQRIVRTPMFARIFERSGEKSLIVYYTFNRNEVNLLTIAETQAQSP